jgi:Metallo-beta-lactamase superfamily
VFPELQPVSNDIAIWHAFDPSVKTELFSTAISTREGIYLIDPIPLAADSLSRLQTRSPIRGIIVTNQNHWRGSLHLADQLSIPAFAHPDAQTPDGAAFVPVADGERISRTLQIIAVEGAAAGEIALVSNFGSGTLIIGDALINIGSYGFTFLPPKYCLNHRKMKKSVARLIDHAFDRMFFAHGLPIVSGAKLRFSELLNRDEPGH